jgi:predicted transcriptional regulator
MTHSDCSQDVVVGVNAVVSDVVESDLVKEIVNEVDDSVNTLLITVKFVLGDVLQLVASL